MSEEPKARRKEKISHCSIAPECKNYFCKVKAMAKLSTFIAAAETGNSTVAPSLITFLFSSVVLFRSFKDRVSKKIITKCRTLF